MPTILERLGATVKKRDVRKESLKLVDKWKKTGLLEGLDHNGDYGTTVCANMALMLENETKQLIKEASTMAGGDVQGFSSVAFPLVRRIFGRAIANKLVSVQPMSLPAGLIFFLDFTYDINRLAYSAGDSVYGGGVVGSQMTGGVKVIDEGTNRFDEKGFYSLNNGYSSATGSLTGLTATEFQAPFEVGSSDITDPLILNDPSLLSGSYATIVSVSLTLAQVRDLIVGDNLVPIVASLTQQSGSVQVRRLTQRDGTTLKFVFHGTASFGSIADGVQTLDMEFPRKDPWNTPHLGAIVGTSPWELEFQPEIPEINIKVDSIPVTTEAKKLKAKWTPELAQDLNAFHNLDADVELTTVLSDHVELEINAELLTDLVRGAKAGVFYWSRRPGKFVDRETGVDITSATAPPDYTGDVSHWYQTLLETVNDLSAQIHRKVRKGGANFMVCGPEVASILEMTNGFIANVAVDDDMGDAGVLKAGTISRKWDVYVDPHFFRQLILIGRKGSGFLESGYVYAPYVPLQTTPTIYGPEDFVPRKAISTRYAKQMVRPDYYGVVVVQNLLG